MRRDGYAGTGRLRSGRLRSGRLRRGAAALAAVGAVLAALPAAAAPAEDGTRLPVGTVIVGAGTTATHSQLLLIDPRGRTRPFETTTDEPPSRSQPAVSPDRRRVAWVEAQVGGGLVAPPLSSVVVAAADGTRVRDVLVHAYLPVWSPDGSTLLVSRGGSYPGEQAPSLWTVDVETGAEQRLLPDGGGNAGTWSPDGSTIAFTRGTEVWQMAADGTAQRRLTSGTGPAYSPDGTLLAFRRGAAGAADLWVRDLATGEERQVTRTAADERLPAWADRSTLLTTSSAADCPAQAGTGCRHVLVRVDVRTGTVRPVTSPAAVDTEGATTPSYAFPAVVLPAPRRSAG